MIIFILIIIILTANSLNTFSATPQEIEQEQKTDEENYYGFIVPIFSETNQSFLSSTQQSISNLINDLLRQNITVYWTTESINVKTISLHDHSLNQQYFETGSFIIPFTQDIDHDFLLSVIIYDYQTQHEIERDHQVNSHLLCEPITVEARKMNQAKPVILSGGYFSQMSTCFYTDTLFLGGFLNTEILHQKDINSHLEIERYNLIVWPGGVLAHPTEIRSMLETSGGYEKSKKIETFIENGGGYIGSCYAANVAASGILFSFDFIKQGFDTFPNLLYHSLIPSVTLSFPITGNIKIRLTNLSHPICAGLEEIQESTHASGPIFQWKHIDEHTQAIGVLDDYRIFFRKGLVNKFPDQIFQWYMKKVTGNPHWITSTQGKGKIVVFSDHPEFHVPTRNDRVIHNSIFYVTSEEEQLLTIRNSYEKSIITKCNRSIPLDKTTPNIAEKIILDTEKNINTIYTQTKLVDNLSHMIYEKSSKGKNNEQINADVFELIDNDYQELLSPKINDVKNDYEQLKKMYHLCTNHSVSTEEITGRLEQFQSDLNNASQILNTSVRTGSDLLKRVTTYPNGIINEELIFKQLKKYQYPYKKSYAQIILLKNSMLKIKRDIWYHFEKETILQNNNHTTKTDVSNSHYVFNESITKKATYYVDVDAPPCGNGSRNHPFHKIQDAIEQAKENDTIFVCSGKYNEHLSISKPVNLQGENKNNTIIDGQHKQHHMIWTFCSYVTISGFTVQNSAINGCGILVFGSNIIIYDCIIRKNYWGIGFFPRSNHNHIHHNYFENNFFCAIAIDEQNSEDITIEQNIIKDTYHYGCILVNKDNIIRNNKFINDSISFYSSDQRIIPTIENNIVNGKPIIYLQHCKNRIITKAGEVILSNCSNITISNLTIQKTETGIYIVDSQDIKINNCTISCIHDGIKIIASKNNTIINNEIKAERGNAIHLQQTKNQIITNNMITSSSTGILMKYCTHNTIKNNDLKNNHLGIAVNTDNNENNFFNNNMINNSYHAYDFGHNHWRNNYYHDWIGIRFERLNWIPYNVPGKIYRNIDLHPLQTYK